MEAVIEGIPKDQLREAISEDLAAHWYNGSECPSPQCPSQYQTPGQQQLHQFDDDRQGEEEEKDNPKVSTDEDEKIIN